MASRNERIERYARAKGADLGIEELRIERFSEDERLWGFGQQGGGGDNEDLEFFGQ
jgi:hypothetical protein